MKTTTKRIKKQPHRYFCMPTTGDEANGNKTVSRIIVFKHGVDGSGSSYFDSDNEPGCAWWSLKEMNKCVEIPAALVERIAKV